MPVVACLVEEAQQEVAAGGRPEQVAEPVDRTERPLLRDLQDIRILDLGVQETWEVRPSDLEPNHFEYGAYCRSIRKHRRIRSHTSRDPSSA